MLIIDNGLLRTVAIIPYIYWENVVREIQSQEVEWVHTYVQYGIRINPTLYGSNSGFSPLKRKRTRLCFFDSRFISLLYL
jgi:hypothetical protein